MPKRAGRCRWAVSVVYPVGVMIYGKSLVAAVAAVTLFASILAAAETMDQRPALDSGQVPGHTG
jgi:hypothetical protein